MPSFPINPQQTTNPSPDQYQRVQATPDSMAAGAARALIYAGQAVTGVGEQFAGIAEVERRKDLARQSKELDNAFSQTVRDTLFGTPAAAPSGIAGMLPGGASQGTPGILARQGANAVDAGPAAIERLEAERDRVLEGISSAELRDAARDMLSQRIESAANRIAGHVAVERQKGLAAASKARSDSFVDDALADYRNAEHVDRKIAEMIGEESQTARLLGLDHATFETNARAKSTAVRAGVIDQYLADNDVAGAQSYFEKHRNEIEGSEHAKIKRAIRAGANRQEAEHADEVRDAVSVLAIGKVPPNLADVQAKVRGTKYAKTLSEAIATRDSVDTFLDKPLPAQAAELAELARKQTMTAPEAAQYQAKATASARAASTIKSGHGLDWAAQQGFIDAPAAVNFGDPETLKERRRQAAIASSRLGVRVDPLSPQEITSLEDALDKAPAAGSTQILNALSAGLGRDGATAVAAGLAKGQRPEYAVAILRSADNPNIAAGIVQGGRLRREHGQNLQLSAGDKRDTIATVFGNMFEGADAGPLNEFVEAADALYASRRVPAGKFQFDGGDYAQALRDVSGGVVRFNGRNTIPPRPDFDQNDMEDIVSQLTADDLIAKSVSNGAPVTASGQVFGPDIFKGSLFGRSGGQLIPTAPGVYRVVIPGMGLVMDGARPGRPYELDLNGMAPRTGPRAQSLVP